MNNKKSVVGKSHYLGKFGETERMNKVKVV